MNVKEEPRIGVFVCRCGINIGGYIEVSTVVEYAKTLPDVVHGEPNLYTCSSDGLSKIKEAVKEHRLNRVVVASCTPRTHEPLFQSACEDAGVNKYLFEMANIRDQCSWVHMHCKEAATEKAKELVRMAVAKARLLKPQEEPEIDVDPVGLVIGGGVSGLTSALSLANQGFKIHLIEKQPELGGMLLKLDKLFPSNRDSADLLNPLIDKVETHANIEIHTNSRVKSVNGFIGNFEVEIEAHNRKTEKINVGTIIVATGAENLEPIGLFGYGEDERIITQLQFEEMFKEGSLKDVKQVVMIQCVGSRSEERPYCSRVCCGEAMKNAILLKEADPSKEVYILYRDLQTYGIHYSTLEWDSKLKGVKLVRYQEDRPPKVVPEEEKVVVKVFTPLFDDEMEIKSDIVVLSTPLVPARDSKELSQLLKVPLNSDGFFMEAHVKLSPLDFATDGIYVCGTAHSPKEVGESISQALGVASRASIPMAKGKLTTDAIMATIDETKCSGCGICVELCPYNAIQKDELGIARVTSAVCKGCGVCGASCPERAITMQHFTNEQLEAQGLAALSEVEE